MNLPMYMLLKKKADAIALHDKYDSLYKKLHSNPYLFNLGGSIDKRLRYYRDMREVYMKKYCELSVIIRRRMYPWS